MVSEKINNKDHRFKRVFNFKDSAGDKAKRDIKFKEKEPKRSWLIQNNLC